ncbi:transposase domain-containing protein, partial [Xanthomonas campestris]
MSLFASALRETLPRVPDRLDQLSTLIEPAWIEQALATSGKASIRRRKLPAEHAVWLVIGLALFRDRPLWQVVQQLDLSLDAQALPAPSASVQARQRLGEEPLAELFGLLTRAWSRTPVDTQRPLRVLAVDGVVWAAPDTAEN